ncbi:hypothetical protein GQ457_14G025840 [Hibiscus cannabinus]
MNDSEQFLPLKGQAQFLVDGWASNSKAGFGGILKDKDRHIRIMFSGPTDQLGVEYAELMAIVTGLEIFIEAIWINKTNLIVQSDSLVILSWISDISLRPWKWWKIFRKLDDMILKINYVRFNHIPRRKNRMADFLATEGKQRATLFKAWW